ncbi:head GIN domain-containing protein [Hymenobacter aerophilus]|uniref:head GIN domain-containing protein n=1 Tax=Hymenobacter aerophilus TaxID=119644 RepID=UPI00037F605C|nr:DUF2807 domain-containing protein [Hymenobacter aerophilus]
MRTHLLLKNIAGAAFLGLLATGSSLAQQLRQVGNFEQLSASGACDVVLTQGPTTSVKVVTEPELERYIKTEVRDGVLTIYRDKDAPRNLFNNRKVTVHVSCPRLSGLRSSGASDITSTSTFEADSFTIVASGASDITLGLNARQLTVTASGASDIKLKGRAERQQVRLSGSSDYSATGLQSRYAEVQASGSSDAYVSAEQLKASASGASDIQNRRK